MSFHLKFPRSQRHFLPPKKYCENKMKTTLPHSSKLTVFPAKDTCRSIRLSDRVSSAQTLSACISGIERHTPTYFQVTTKYLNIQLNLYIV